MAKKPKAPEVAFDQRLIWGGAIFAAALLLRLIYVFRAADGEVFGFLTFDRLYYQQIAEQFLLGLPFEHELLFKPQVYPLLVGFIFKEIGADVLIPLIIQAFFGAISCSLIFLIALRLFSLRIAVTAGVIASLYGTLIYYVGEPLPITLVILLNLVTIYILLRYDETRRWWLALVGGVLAGLAVASEPTMIVFVVAVVIWIFRRKSKRRVFRVQEASLIVAGILLAVTPFWLRALNAGDEEVPFATTLGITLAMGNNIEAQGNTLDLPRSSAEDGFDYNALVEISNRANFGERAPDKYGSLWAGEALKYIASHPGDWLLLEARKLGYMLMGYENWRHKPLYFFADQTTPLKFLLWDNLISFPFGLILPLALVAFFAAPERKPGFSLLLGYLISGVVVLLLTYVAEGQRLIYLPAVIILAAAGLWQLIERYRGKDFARFYKLAAILIGALVLCNCLTMIPGLSPRVNDRAEGEVYAASALIMQDRLVKARIRLDRALRLEPRMSRAHLTMGNLLLKQQQYDQAINRFRQAVTLAPEDPMPKEALANLLQQLNRMDELNQFLANVIKEYPQENWAHRFYSNLHVRLEEYMQAADIMERAYLADSTYFDAIFIKAEVYLRADMRVEAEKELKRYLGYMPNSVEAHANLGQVYARQRRFDEALGQFEYVRALQGWNPGSYFNLATLRYQMGEFERADAYLDTALMLNPEFPGVAVMRARIDSAATASQN